MRRFTARQHRVTRRQRIFGEHLETRQLLTRLVDFDTDGDLDAYDASSWYENLDGQGNLRAHEFTNAADNRAEVADLDGDGDLDFVTTEPKWYENLDGRGTSFAPHSFPGGNLVAKDVRVEDVGGDGDNDVILIHDGRISWYENPGQGQEFQFHWLSIGSLTHRLVNASDMDRDGDLDVILEGTIPINEMEWKATFLGINDGQGGFALQTVTQVHPFAPATLMLVDFVDINGDEYHDLISSYHAEFSNTYAWHPYDPANPGAILERKGLDVRGLIGEQVRDAFVDWDRDGDLDAAGRNLPDKTGLLWKNEAGQFVAQPSFPPFDATSPNLTSVGDLNGDGTIDWITATILDNAPVWYDGTNGAPHQNRLPNPLLPGDTNRDYYLDEADLIAVAKSARWQLSATWATGDWNGAPGGTQDVPPVGDGRFDQTDLQALQSTNLYQQGAYVATNAPPVSEWEAMRLSLDANDLVVSYEVATGRVQLRSELQFSALQLHSVAGRFTSAPALFSGPFDLATAQDLFHFDLNGFGVADLGAILPPNLSWEQVQNDLKIDGARVQGGELGNVRLACTGCGLDVEAVRTAIAAGTHARWSDLNGDAQTNANDLAYLLTEHLQSSVGDANLDGQFNSTDLLLVFQRGKYESAEGTGAIWEDGDWNGDSRFDSGDLTFAFQVGRYDDIPTSPVSTPGTNDFLLRWPDCTCYPTLSRESVVDLDGDGDRDLLVSNRYERRVAWHENLDGLGTFGHARIIASQFVGVETAIASDVDGDGDLDVLASSTTSGYGSGRIHWYENIGGTDVFRAEPHLIDSPAGAYQLALGDLDRDGDPDLVLGQNASETFGAVIWYANDGRGNFANAVTLDSGPGNLSLAVMDFDGDGDLDIFNASLGNFRWFENNGQGNFTKKAPVASGSAMKFAFGDVDRDGHLDIVSSAWFAASLFNYRDGTFVETKLPINNLALDAALADIDQDGDLDMALQTTEEGIWLLNDGHGTFGAPQDFGNAYVGQVADVDGDGDQDLTNGINWWENKAGKFYFAEWIQDAPPAITEGVEAVDLDGDLDLDLLSDRWYKRLSAKNSYETYPLDDGRHYSVDLDGDGDLDIVTQLHQDIFWRENENGEGVWSERRRIRETTDLRTIQQLAFDDVDVDGDVDIIASIQDRVVWFEHLSERGTFELNREIVIDRDRSSAAVMADLDGDGLRDLLTSQGWHRKLAAGGFAPRQAYPDGVLFASLVVAKDLDLDGDLDLLLTDSSSSFWMENLGGGQLGRRSTLRAVSTTMDAADLDLDGDVDLVYGDPNGEVGWLERVSGAEPTYQAHLLYVGHLPYQVLAVDHDQDGDTDILTAHSFGTVVAENRRLL